MVWWVGSPVCDLGIDCLGLTLGDVRGIAFRLGADTGPGGAHDIDEFQCLLPVTGGIARNLYVA